MRTLIVTAGLIAEGFGGVLMVKANVGTGSWTTLAQGLSGVCGVSVGRATMLISLVVLAADILLQEKIGIGTVLDTFIYSISFDAFDAVFALPAALPKVWNYYLLLAGIAVEAVGLCICLKGALSCGPRDLLTVALGKKLKKIPIGAISMSISFTLILAVTLLGAKFGLGTLLVCFTGGPILQAVFGFFRFDSKKVVHEGFFQTFESIRGIFRGKNAVSNTGELLY